MGLLLFAFNFAGFFIPLRNPEIYNEPATCFPNDITLTQDQLWTIIRETERLPAELAVPVLNDAINRGIACYWKKDGSAKYNLRLPIFDNYLLYAASYIRPHYKMFIFCDYRKAIERGVGQCDQHAIIIAELLSDRGIRSGIVGLTGHIVATAEIRPDTWWILDPDYGVVVKHSMEEIERNPELVVPAYLEKGYSQKTANNMKRAYGPEGNRVAKDVDDYFRSKKCKVERVAYALKWLIPISFLVFYVILRRE